jgi:Flp pilus assembly protein TadG
MRKARGESGQVLVVMMIVLIALLGVAAFAVDVGYAYYAKRQLQSATDAAALAGAQDLPTAATAIATATSYATTNTPPNLSQLQFTYTTKCTATAILATGCVSNTNPNELVVTGTAQTNTWFAKLFGIPHFNVATHANACSPCSSTPVDIVVAIDRTGSMCSPTDRFGNCIDLNNAKDGVRTMLSILNPPYAQVGMVAFPPVQSTSTDVCSAPYDSLPNGFNGYDSPSRGYLVDQISSNYKTSTGTALNTSSGLYLHTDSGDDTACIEAGGNTSYSEALRQSQAELLADGRPNVPNYIVFLTDGEANIGSVYPGTGTGASFVPDPTYPPGNSDDTKPCQTAIDLANAYKAAGTTIYSIGYALGNNVACTQGAMGDWTPKVNAVYNSSGQLVTPAVPAHWAACSQPDPNCEHYASSTPESPSINSYNTLDDIASPNDFYNQPSAGQLNTIFAAIASDIASGSSRLVDDAF